MTANPHATFARLAVTFLVAFLLAYSSPGEAVAQMGGGMGHGGGGNTGNMGRGMGGAMLVSGDRAYRSDGTLMRIDDAIAVAERYVSSLGASGLALDEVEEWNFNFYVVVKETAPPQLKAFELLVDKWSGAVMPEPGPNMMWNEKYRPRSRHLGISPSTQPMTITPQAAAAAATTFLRERFPSLPTAAVGEPDTFYGYYTFDVTDAPGGATIGMLGVNGRTAQVWYHTWHGGFVQSREVE